MIFQEIKKCLECCQFEKIDKVYLKHLPQEVDNIRRAYAFGEGIPSDFIELRDFVYKRVAKDIKYQNTGIINDHFCYGAIFGIIRLFDMTINDDLIWEEIKENV